LFSPRRDENGAWFEAFGGRTDVDSGSSATDTGYDADSFGFIVGYDTGWNENWKIGAALAYSDISIDAGSNTTDLDAYSFNAYAGYQSNQFFFNGAVSYTSADADASRTSSLVGDIDSDSDLDQFSALSTAGIVLEYGKSKITPFVSLQYSHVSQDDFTENGGFGLDFSADDVDVLELGVGVEFSTEYTVLNKPSYFRAQLAYYNDVITDERSLRTQLPGGDSFDLESQSISSSSVELELETGFELTPSQKISIGYEGDYNSDLTNHTGFLRYSIQF